MAIKINPPSPVSAIIREGEVFNRELLERAYDQGFKAGFGEAQRRILEAATVATSLSVAPAVVAQRPARGRATRKSRAHPNSSAQRRFPYGAIANAFRKALLHRSGAGITTDEMIRAAATDLGISPNDIKHRDTIKRLREKDEMVTHGGLHFPGSALLADAQNGNGAQNGQAASAPSAGEGPTSPNENSPGFRLVS